MSEYNNNILSVNLGRTDYKRVWDLQKKLVDLRHQGEVDDLLLFTEHNPVITMGRAGSPKNVLTWPGRPAG